MIYIVFGVTLRGQFEMQPCVKTLSVQNWQENFLTYFINNNFINVYIRNDPINIRAIRKNLLVI